MSRIQSPQDFQLETIVTKYRERECACPIAFLDAGVLLFLDCLVVGRFGAFPAPVSRLDNGLECECAVQCPASVSSADDNPNTISRCIVRRRWSVYACCFRWNGIADFGRRYHPLWSEVLKKAWIQVRRPGILVTISSDTRFCVGPVLLHPGGDFCGGDAHPRVFIQGQGEQPQR